LDAIGHALTGVECWVVAVGGTGKTVVQAGCANLFAANSWNEDASVTRRVSIWPRRPAGDSAGDCSWHLDPICGLSPRSPILGV